MSKNGYIKHLNSILINENEIINTNGAGDSLTGAIIAGLLNNQTVETSVRMGLKAAYLSLKSQNAVHPNLTLDMISLSAKL